jgi:hypothetical protein
MDSRTGNHWNLRMVSRKANHEHDLDIWRRHQLEVLVSDGFPERRLIVV